MISLTRSTFPIGRGKREPNLLQVPSPHSFLRDRTKGHGPMPHQSQTRTWELNSSPNSYIGCGEQARQRRRVHLGSQRNLGVALVPQEARHLLLQHQDAGDVWLVVEGLASLADARAAGPRGEGAVQLLPHLRNVQQKQRRKYVLRNAQKPHKISIYGRGRGETTTSERTIFKSRWEFDPYVSTCSPSRLDHKHLLPCARCIYHNWVNTAKRSLES